MSPPQPSDLLLQALRRCEGYGELGMWHQAWEELEGLPDEERTRLPVLIVRIRVLVGMGFHQNAVSLGRRVAQMFPQSVGVREAVCDALIALAKSEAQTGDKENAKEYIAQCVEIDPERRHVILEEPELRSLWLPDA